MEKKELAIEGPLTIGEHRVYVTTDTRITCRGNRGRLVCSAVRRPTFIVVVSSAGRRAFTVAGEEIAVECVVEEFGEIEGPGQGQTRVSPG